MDDLLSKLEKLDPREIDYVIARSTHNTIKAACEEAEISESSFYKWDNRDEIEEFAKALKLDRYIEVELRLRRVLPEAIKVIIAGLKERKYDTKFKAAVEILDRVLGKPAQKINQKTDERMEIIVTYEDKRKDSKSS